jgi:hypothetical protein
MVYKNITAQGDRSELNAMIVCTASAVQVIVAKSRDIHMVLYKFQ